MFLSANGVVHYRRDLKLLSTSDALIGYRFESSFKSV